MPLHDAFIVMSPILAFDGSSLGMFITPKLVMRRIMDFSSKITTPTMCQTIASIVARARHEELL
jgi:hypothetical protein